MYSAPDVKPWTSAKWTPPGHMNRKQRNVGVLETRAETTKLPPFRISDEFATGGHVEKSMSGDVMTSVVTREKTYEHIEDNAS